MDKEKVQRKKDLVVYLSPTFFPYRVPVYDALYAELGDKFVVVALDNSATTNSMIALGMGRFPRQRIKGTFTPLSKQHNTGQESPFGLLITPSFPFVLKSLNPEVVISNNFSIWTFASLLLGYKTIIFWEGTLHTERTVQFWRERLRRWMAKRAKAFVVDGKLAKQYLVERLGVPVKKILEGGMCAAPPPAEYASFIGKYGEISSRESVKFLFCGRLVELKGVAHLLNAAKILSELPLEGKSFQIILTGDGPQRTVYEKMSGELGIHHLVTFTGYVPPDKIWEYYAKSHVFVLPTLQDNWPLVVPEAMSMGMPVLLSKYAGSVPDLIREGENGHSFDPTNYEELASFMAQYLKCPKLIKEHGRVSLKIIEPYNAKNVADLFLQAIENINN